jgi:transposase
VIFLNQKKEIILMHIRDGKSQRQISKETGVCRETIRKYIKEYESKLVTVNETLNEEDKTDIIDDITSKPKYTTCKRVKRAITDEVLEKLTGFLKENEQKRLTGLSRQ